MKSKGLTRCFEARLLLREFSHQTCQHICFGPKGDIPRCPRNVGLSSETGSET
jgi:hypothetical protein